MPNIIYAFGLYQAYSALGLIGTETGLALAHNVLGMPDVLITVNAVLSHRDVQLAVAVRTLGAGPVWAFSLVRFPLIRRSVIAISVSCARATTLPKMMWDGVTNVVNPTISAVSALMIAVSITLIVVSAVASGQWRARK